MREGGAAGERVLGGSAVAGAGEGGGRVGLVGRVRPAPPPVMSRQGYRWEVVSSAYMPVARGCLEAGLLGVIADKAFGAPALVVATITAAPAMANITSAFWLRMIHGVDRVRAVFYLQLLTLACIGVIALAPFNAFGQVMLVVGVLLGRASVAGILTARADVWRANYPRDQRARLTGLLTMISLVAMNVMALNVGSAMDVHGGGAYRVVFGVGILWGVVGALAWSRVRWRGRAQQLAQERRRKAVERGSAGLSAMWGVLRADRKYRRFMTAQFLLGLPNLAATAPFIDGLNARFDPSYSVSVALAQVIPFSLPIVCIPLWARLLDRVHIIAFRSVHSWVFVVANVLTGVGFLTHELWVLVAARVVLGVAFGGGMLAWNLGHHDFASRELASLYMGVHVTLTGVRGAVGPYLGVLMFSGVSFGGVSWEGMGGWAFVVFGVVGSYAAWMFVKMRGEVGSEPEG